MTGDLRIAQLHLAGRDIGDWAKQALAADEATCGRIHAIVGGIHLIELKHIECRARQIQGHLSVLRMHGGRQRTIGVYEPAVIDQVGKMQRGVIAGEGIQGQQHEQHQGQPQQQAKAQTLACQQTVANCQ
jgi:hypothetical protein